MLVIGLFDMLLEANLITKEEYDRAVVVAHKKYLHNQAITNNINIISG